MGVRRIDRKWRSIILIAIPFAAFGVLLLQPPIAQPDAYHAFADDRRWLNVPNFANVVSNLAFLLSGGLGLRLCVRCGTPKASASWIGFFAGVTLVAVGSTYYHWNPNDETLVWDRLPITVGFMGFYVAVLTQYAELSRERILLPLALFAGAGSVVYWDLTGDLRLYFAVQATSLLTTLAIVVLSCSDRDRRFLGWALGSYAASLVCEQLDRQIFSITRELVSGHTAKHGFAALAPYLVFVMHRTRSGHA